ncbi:hypothetical protein A33M_3656 [Rhodovulum sp. PH10]|nr:hypothetical protein A33M_3656 [Rhodovulum sp. PH10]
MAHSRYPSVSGAEFRCWAPVPGVREPRACRPHPAPSRRTQHLDRPTTTERAEPDRPAALRRARVFAHAETFRSSAEWLIERASPLTQGRGSKHGVGAARAADRRSPLTQGRGSKHRRGLAGAGQVVAPHAGAWIETGSPGSGGSGCACRPSRRGVDRNAPSSK